jgi:hypothetical protein
LHPHASGLPKAIARNPDVDLLFRMQSESDKPLRNTNQNIVEQFLCNKVFGSIQAKKNLPLSSPTHRGNVLAFLIGRCTSTAGKKHF